MLAISVVRVAHIASPKVTSRLQRIVTVGVYGFTPEAFHKSILGAGVDVFCDLRARRGVRGKNFSFANVQRLQPSIEAMGVRYIHFPELAPTPEIRELQREADRAASLTKRKRNELSSAFVSAYELLLDHPNAQAALQRICDDAEIPALFCVERLPGACHRSLVASRLSANHLPIEDLLP